MKRSSLHFITSAVAAALFVVACSVGVAAQERMQDHPRGEGMQGNRNFGTGLGIGIGIGILQGLTTPPAGQSTPSKDTSASHKTDAKPPKRAAKKDDKVPPPVPKLQTTDKPPPTSDKPPPTPNGSPPSQTTETPPATASNPPATNNPPTPANPPSSQPVAPPAETAQKADDCPQRGRGCTALLIDFLKYGYVNGHDESEIPSGFDDVADALDKLKCNVERAEPDIKRTTSWTRKMYIGLGGVGIHWESQTDPDGTEEEHNKSEMEKLAAKIEKHRQTVRTLQPETVIEMVAGHGGGPLFGRWSAHSEFAKNHLDRDTFHSGNYDAVKHNACGWFVYDDSCFSGKTAWAIDVLNNTGKATPLLQQPSNSCPLHAAYEADIAIGTAADDKCAYLGVGARLLSKTVMAALKWRLLPEKPYPLPITPLAEQLGSGETPSKYSDKGYHYCGTPERTGINYKSATQATVAPSPPPPPPR